MHHQHSHFREFHRTQPATSASTPAQVPRLMMAIECFPARRSHPDIAEDTRQRVLKRIKELDYQPNAIARSLVTGRSYLVGLIVPDLLHPFFAEMAKSLSAAIGKHDYSTIMVGKIATEHLIQQGCKNIAHIRGLDNSVGIKRSEGYRRALKSAGFRMLTLW